MRITEARRKGYVYTLVLNYKLQLIRPCFRFERGTGNSRNFTVGLSLQSETQIAEVMRASKYRKLL